MVHRTGAINEDEEYELIREQQRESCDEDEEFWLSGGELDCMVRPWRGTGSKEGQEVIGEIINTCGASYGDKTQSG